MITPFGIRHLLKHPDNANILFFKRDRTLPFSIRAGLVNAYRRHAREATGVAIKGPTRPNRVYRKRVTNLLPRFYSDPALLNRLRGRPANTYKINIRKVVEVEKSRGRNRVSTKRDVYYKNVPTVVHLTGTKGLWKGQDDG